MRVGSCGEVTAVRCGGEPRMCCRADGARAIDSTHVRRQNLRIYAHPILLSDHSAARALHPDPRGPARTASGRRSGQTAAPGHRGLGAGAEGRHPCIHARRAAAGCRRPVQRTQHRSVGVGQPGEVARAVDGGRRHHDREQGRGEYRDETQLRQLSAAPRIPDPGGDERVRPIAGQQRPLSRVDRSRRCGLRAADSRLVREQDLRERPGGQHIQAVHPACQRLQEAR